MPPQVEAPAPSQLLPTGPSPFPARGPQGRAYLLPGLYGLPGGTISHPSPPHPRPEGQSVSLAPRLELSSTSGPPPSPPSDQGRGPPLTRLLSLATSAYFQMAIDSGLGLTEQCETFQRKRDISYM